MRKWRILLQILPLTGLFCLVKLWLYRLGWQPWQFDAFTGALFATASFVTSFVLNGTLTEYRRSEELPILIVNALESIQDCHILFASLCKDYDPRPLEQQLAAMAASIVEWLLGKDSIDKVYRQIDKINLAYQTMSELGGANWIQRPQIELGKIRLYVQQIRASRDSDFVAPAYIILLIFLLAAIVALLLIRGENITETFTVSVFIFVSFVYLFVLIRDLENPFQYDGTSSVDVDLSPLLHFGQRYQVT
ncbi:MAG: hypothetical protein RMK91_02805 [Pseudanabaenaceae cyanobacterium SKYGB_i_bin29]|nr:hypothetical protein [Pseudanabaenaceae cyanobacterium SKYG29]MDW8420774.1 hypothetical protein [Pseudanabaenaceae cyanobacterium SKYGB_i_bin29]